MSVVLQADARQLPIADGVVQCVVTSPPYWGLRDYGTSGQLGLEPTPDAYVANMVQVFRQVWRVLRDDGVLFLNLGDSYASDTNGSGGPTAKQASNAGSFHNGARKLDHGLKPKDLVGIPWRVAFALQADGWYLRSDIIWSKPNPMPESVTDRPTKAHEYVFLLSKSASYYWDAEAVKEPTNRPDLIGRPNGHWGNPDKGARAESMGRKASGNEGSGAQATGYTHRNIRSVWSIATQPYSGAHFATMPEKLVERCVLAGSRPGDLVLDPFVGSGTVARVAISLGRKVVGCDLNRQYLALAEERTEVTMGLPLEMGA